MKWWREVQKDAYSYYGFFSKSRANDIVGDIPELSVFAINGEQIFDSVQSSEFVEVCSRECIQMFRKYDELSEYKIYLFANVELRDKKSAVENYKKVWKLLQRKISIGDLSKGPELLVNLGERSFYTSVAEIEMDDFSEALQIVSENPYKFALIATKRVDALSEAFTQRVFKCAFNVDLGNQYRGIDYFALSLNLCRENDFVFRWGDSSEEAELAIINNGILLKLIEDEKKSRMKELKAIGKRKFLIKELSNTFGVLYEELLIPSENDIFCKKAYEVMDVLASKDKVGDTDDLKNKRLSRACLIALSKSAIFPKEKARLFIFTGAKIEAVLVGIDEVFDNMDAVLEKTGFSSGRGDFMLIDDDFEFGVCIERKEHYYEVCKWGID